MRTYRIKQDTNIFKLLMLGLGLCVVNTVMLIYGIFAFICVNIYTLFLHGRFYMELMEFKNGKWVNKQ